MSTKPKQQAPNPPTQPQQKPQQKPPNNPPNHPPNHSPNNPTNQSQPHQNPPTDQPKQLRRIAQRSQMPTDKTQLIQYLSTRIKQAEDALIDTDQLLEEEVKEREKIAKALDQRNQQLSKLYQVDQRALPEKIKEKLNQILTTTVTQKIESEEKLTQEKLKNYQYKARYEELKWEDRNNKAKLEDQEKKQNQLNADIQSLDALNKGHQEELTALQTQYHQVRQQKQSLQNKYLQMKVALDRMSDIKGVLNRFFGNEDLFDQKMQLKQQKIQKLPQPAKQSPILPPSRESRTKPLNNNSTKLKPIIGKTKNDDDDFWKADFKGK